MSKRMFAKGTLVRKTTRWGTPIGDWMEVVVANAHHVYTKYIDHEDVMLFDRKRIWKPRMVRLVISKEKAEDILKRGCIVVSHVKIPSWVNARLAMPDIIMFHTCDGWYKIYCTIDGIYTGGYDIKVVINRVIKTQIGICS